MAERGVALTDSVLARSDRITPSVSVLEFRLDDSAGVEPRPGQFFHVDCGGGREHLLRRPLSVLDYRPGPGPGLSFLVEAVGWGTKRLCSMAPGERVNVLGPLGSCFSPPSGGRVLLVAGGMGIAPISYLARELDGRGVEYDLLAGFRDAGQYFAGVEELGAGVCVFTEDGSRGTAGTSCDGLSARLQASSYSAAFTCGPEAMMAKVAKACESAGITCQVSLDSRMACGLGACRGCVREGADGGNLCVCMDGPVFDSKEVSWRE